MNPHIRIDESAVHSSIDRSCRGRKAMKWMRVRMSQWWNGCTFCERNKAFSASSSRMRELCLATWAFSDATSEVVVDWYRGRQQERKKKQRTYSRRSMARRQRWRSVATGRQRRQAWISFSSPRRDARGDEIGEIDSRVAKRILYEFESEFVNFVVRKVTRGALSGRWRLGGPPCFGPT